MYQQFQLSEGEKRKRKGKSKEKSQKPQESTGYAERHINLIDNSYVLI